MPEKPKKLSNFISFDRITPEDHARAVDKDLDNVFIYLQEHPYFISQASEPTIVKGTFSFWEDSDNSKIYLIYSKDGTQKKVELT